MEASTDTIVAPATAPGGALSVVRLCGPHAIAIADTLFRGRHAIADTPTHTLRYGRIVDGAETLDDVVAAVFRAPASYTGDDTVEFTCHGSRYIVGELLRLCCRAGARPAQAGEFTVRAFLAGRLDLAQAEAVADLIAADSRAAHKLATTQLRGAYSSALGELRRQLLELVSLLELELDFSEEDVAFADRTALAATMQALDERIGLLTDSFRLGNALKKGIPVAIVGRPNAGKSTLLNRLAGEERALVSEIAGTTRDTIEQCVNIDGILFRFIDTAGLHDTQDRLERMGIERTHKALEEARIVLHLLDPTQDESLAGAPACAAKAAASVKGATHAAKTAIPSAKPAAQPAKAAAPSAKTTAPSAKTAAHALASALSDARISIDGASVGKFSDSGASVGELSDAGPAEGKKSPTSEPYTKTASKDLSADNTGEGFFAVGSSDAAHSGYNPGAGKSPTSEPYTKTASKDLSADNTGFVTAQAPLDNPSFIGPTGGLSGESSATPDRIVIPVYNKTDLRQPDSLPEEAVAISARTGAGIDALRDRLLSVVDTAGLYRGDPIVSNSRHLEALVHTREALARARQALESAAPADLLCEELRPALYHLGTITGQITTDEVLSEIFSKFCIGK